jgi:hypothetical protein
VSGMPEVAGLDLPPRRSSRGVPRNQRTADEGIGNTNRCPSRVMYEPGGPGSGPGT